MIYVELFYSGSKLSFFYNPNQYGFETFIWVEGRQILFLFLCCGCTHDFVTFLVSLDEDKECARNIHTKCAEKLVKAGTDLCTNVNNFVTCYDNFIGGSTPLPPSCTKIPEITKKFDEVIDLFSKYLIKRYKADTQHSMCKVDNKVLDGDCI